MGAVNKSLECFEPVRRHALEKLLQKYRRRVDQNNEAVTLTTNDTTTAFTLYAPANELAIGSVIHVISYGTVTNATGGALDLTPTLSFDGTTLWTDAISVTTTADDAKPWVLDVRITFTHEKTIKAAGFISVGADATAAATGTGSTAGVALIANPFYHTLTSQVLGNHRVALTMALANNLTGNKQAASMWIE